MTRDGDLFNTLERENVELTQRLRAQDAELATLRERRTQEYTPIEADAERAAQRNRELLAMCEQYRRELDAATAALHRLLSVTKQREAQARAIIAQMHFEKRPSDETLAQARAWLAANPAPATDAPPGQEASAEHRRALRQAAIRAARPHGDACPWCGYAQQHMPDFPLAVATHDYTCEHCGKPIKVAVYLRTAWALTLRKPEDAPTEQQAGE